MQFRAFETPDLLANAVAEEIVRAVENGARFIALSGGESPRETYELLGKGALRGRLSQFPVCWIVGDERFVDPDDARSNRGMIESTLFRDGVAPTHRWLYFETRDVEPATAALRFEAEWHAAGVPSLDVAVLGVGEDGHTASLFPGHDVLSVTGGIARAVWAEHLQAWRLTLTLPVLQEAGSKLVLAGGRGKQAIARRAAAGEDLPITRIAGGREAVWFV